MSIFLRANENKKKRSRQRLQYIRVRFQYLSPVFFWDSQGKYF